MWVSLCGARTVRSSRSTRTPRPTATVELSVQRGGLRVHSGDLVAQLADLAEVAFDVAADPRHQVGLLQVRVCPVDGRRVVATLRLADRPLQVLEPPVELMVEPALLAVQVVQFGVDRGRRERRQVTFAFDVDKAGVGVGLVAVLAVTSPCGA